MSKESRQLTLELEQPLAAEQPIYEHDLTPEPELTLDQLTEWDLQFTRGFSRDMYTRVRENARSMYVLMREILPIFDLLVERAENDERAEKTELPKEYIARIRERLEYFLRDSRRVQPDSQEKILPRSYQQKKINANRRNGQ